MFDIIFNAIQGLLSLAMVGVVAWVMWKVYKICQK